MYPIDFVFPWVDGNDPTMKAKHARFADSSQINNEDVAGETRFNEVGEIFYCVGSILRFAPWTRKIFIITDEQNPQIDDFVTENFPDATTKIEIVDHKAIFKGYEDRLPFCNSNAIETCMFNIPDLSEHFIYMNDDFFLLKPVSPKDFFVDDNVVCFANWHWTWQYRLARFLVPRKHGQVHTGFKDFQFNGMKIIGTGSRFLNLAHSPRPLLKSWYSDFYSAHPEALEINLGSRFREPWHWQTQEPFYLDMYRKDKAIIIPKKAKGLYLKPKRKHGYVDKKMKSWSNSNAIYLCANSLDQALPEDIKKVQNWLDRRIGLPISKYLNTSLQ